MITNIQVGQVGVSPNTPSWVYIETNDTFATVTGAGYLSGVASEYVNAFKTNMVAIVSTKTSRGLGVPPVVYFMQLSNNNGSWSLVPQSIGEIIGNLVVQGSITSSLGITASSGNIVATDGNVVGGSNGNPGGFISWPSSLNMGNLNFFATNNSAGNFDTAVTNASTIAQVQTIRIPDCGGNLGNFLVTSGVLVNGNLIKAVGSGGRTVDAGIAATDVMLLDATNTLTGSGKIVLPKVNGTEAANAVTANGTCGVITTSSLTTAGGSSYSITWSNTSITSTSVIQLTLLGGTNTTHNISWVVTPGTNSATLVIYNNTSATALNGTLLLGYTVL